MTRPIEWLVFVSVRQAKRSSSVPVAPHSAASASASACACGQWAVTGAWFRKLGACELHKINDGIASDGQRCFGLILGLLKGAET